MIFSSPPFVVSAIRARDSSCARDKLGQAIRATAKELEQAEVTEDLELLADSVADVGVVGMEFRGGFAVSVHVR
jgi:hypothetical protein